MILVKFILFHTDNKSVTLHSHHSTYNSTSFTDSSYMYGRRVEGTSIYYVIILFGEWFRSSFYPMLKHPIPYIMFTYAGWMGDKIENF